MLKKIFIVILFLFIPLTVAAQVFDANQVIIKPYWGWLYATSSTGSIAASSSPTVNYITATSTTATSTFGYGINLKGGCFAILNVCISGGGGSGTVTSVQLSTPNTSLSLGGTNPITTSGTISADINTAHRNDYTTLQTFSSLFATIASTTNATTSSFAILNLALPAGTFLATDALGNVIATTSPQKAGNYITALTGDISATGPGSAAATLATVNGNVGSFTNANITVNGKGLITAASNGTGGSGSAYPFPLPGNATSTITQFNGGLTAYSTSTIGDGTQGGGLTVSGGSTTTLNALFQGLVALNTPANSTSLTITGNSSTVPSSFGLVDSTTASNSFTSFMNPSGTSNANVNTIPLSATFSTGAGVTGGLVFASRPAAAPIIFFAGGNSIANNDRLHILGGGNIGISSSTPGSLLSVGTTNGINFSTATSTFSSTGGVDLRGGGCFAINGTCIAGSGGTTYSGTFPINVSGSVISFSGPFDLIPCRSREHSVLLRPEHPCQRGDRHRLKRNGHKRHGGPVGHRHGAHRREHGRYLELLPRGLFDLFRHEPEHLHAWNSSDLKRRNECDIVRSEYASRF